MRSFSAGPEAGGEARCRRSGGGEGSGLESCGATLRGEAAELMGLSLRQRMAQFARRFDQGEMRLRDAERFFNQRTAAENYKFIDDIEHGRSTGNSDMDAIAGVFRKMLDQRRTEVQALGEGALERFYTHYFPHIFERTQQAEGFVKSFFGQRTFEGAKVVPEASRVPNVQGSDRGRAEAGFGQSGAPGVHESA